MLTSSQDTIAAISTAPGQASLGIIRINGKKALEVVAKIFSPMAKDGLAVLNSIKTQTVHFGHIINPKTSETIDEAMLTFFKGPRSYTTEDIIELTCHGGNVVLQAVLEACLSQGCRLAEPGEFTKRAFLNGRMDLSQAEAVADIIQSKTELSLKIALEQLEGSISRQVKLLRDAVLEVLAFVEAHLDFPEEDIDHLSLDKIKAKISAVTFDLAKIMENAGQGKILREGLLAVIVGKPNVGKSSLLNALLQHNRAIVTEIPGTTRDIIEEGINLKGIPIRLVDTAGIRVTKDIVEKEGIERSRQALEKADLALFMVDGSRDLDTEDHQLFALIKNRKIIIVVNKQDLPQKYSKEKVTKEFAGCDVINLSTVTGAGLDDLKEKITSLFFSGEVDFEHGLISNVRHKNALEKAALSLKNVEEGLAKNVFQEFLCVDLRDSLDHLGVISGETTTEDLLSEIFSRFCIGK